MKEKLSREIVRHCFEILGVFADEPTEGPKASQHLIDTKFSIQWNEDEETEHSMWCSKVTIESSVLNFLLADLSLSDSDENDLGGFEYLLLSQWDQAPVYAITISSNDEYCNFTLIQDGSKISPTIQVQCQFLTGLMQLISDGMVWVPAGRLEELEKLIPVVADVKG